MDFNNLCIPGNRNECPWQISSLMTHFICDVNMALLYFHQDTAPAQLESNDNFLHILFAPKAVITKYC